MEQTLKIKLDTGREGCTVILKIVTWSVSGSILLTTGV